MNFTLNKTMVASGVALALGGGATAHAELVTGLGPASQPSDSSNFSMLNDAGGMVGGTNDVASDWDGTGYNASSDYTGPGVVTNVTAVSTTTFNSHVWTAHDIQVFVPGSYSFDTSLGGGAGESAILNVTVPAGQIGMHMLFDWNGNNNIDVFVVAAPSSVFGAGIARSQAGVTAYGGNNCDAAVIVNCLWDGKAPGSDGKPAGDKVWLLGSVDGDGDGVMGIPMVPGGPFQGFNANFNMQFSVSNFPPTAGNFSVSASANQANTIDLLLPGRAEDTDDGVDPTSTVIRSGPANGAIVVNNDGTVTYTPTAAYTGPDSFDYTVLDNSGSISNVGTASITVTLVPNTPPNANDTTFTIDEDVATNIPVTSVADDGGDGPGPLIYNTFDALSAQGGTLTVDTSNTVLTYTPLANFNGTDTFAFTVDDGIDSSTPATITMIVNAVNDAPVCTDVPLNMDPDTVLSIDVATSLLSTCRDPDVGDTITLDSTTQPTQGGTLTFDGVNTLTYTPPAGFTGQDTFTYTATDGTATDTRTVFVNVGRVFGNFTMVDGDGVTFGGTNDLVFTWDGTCYNSVAEADAGPANMAMGSDSDAKFFGFPWTAHDIKVYCPGGPYVIDTCNDASVPPDKCGPASMTVPAGHLGGHLLFNWNGTLDIDVLNVWNNSTGGSWQNIVPTGQLYQGPVGPTPSLDQVYEWISVDADGDGVPGIRFVDGPFIDFRANFNFNAVGGTGGPITAPPTSISSPNLGSTGCSIAKAPVDPLSRGDWVVVAGFLAWLGGFVGWRRRKDNDV